MRFGSVCSGIEAASVAWHPLGWKAAWLSEIEPFPSAVLAHHYPDVPNLGDMTTLPERILSGEVEAPDLFCGGTPCQAFSVAGLRNSLDDARGNLSLTFVGIANAIDHVRSVRRDSPAIIFWENVPGVLSTKDNAFGCFLGALAGEDEPIIPSGEKWTNAGCVYGPQRAVAWRVLDAQYFGVAQRRRRVFVIASARDDFDPAAVLFEFDGVRRDSAPSREKGQAIAPCVTNGAPFSRTGNERVEAEAMVVGRSHWDGDYPHPTLNQSANCGGVGFSNQEIFSQRGAYLAPQPVAARMVAFGEYSIDGTASAMKARDYKDATDLVAHTFSTPAIGHIVEDDVACTMTKNTGGGGETQNPAFVAQPSFVGSLCARTGLSMSVQDADQGHLLVQPISIQDVRPVEKAQNGKGWNDDGTAYTVDTHATQGVAQPTYAIQGSMIGRNEKAGPQGDGINEEVCFTQNCVDRHAVAQPVNIYGGNKRQDRPEGGFYVRLDEDTSKTLDAATGLNPTCSQGGTAVMQPIGIFQDSEFGVAQYDSAGTLRAGRIPEHQMVMQPMVLMDQGGSVMNVEHDMVGTLLRETHGHEPVVMQSVGVDIFNAAVTGDVAVPLTHRSDGTGTGPTLLTAMQVRRLTPVECERLQGFPDGYTNIPWRKKPEAPDGPRYKALGNSWAVPNVRWIGKRIQEALNAPT